MTDDPRLFKPADGPFWLSQFRDSIERALRRVADFIGVGEITTDMLADSAVTTAKLAESYVQSSGGTFTGDIGIDTASNSSLIIEAGGDTNFSQIALREQDYSSGFEQTAVLHYGDGATGTTYGVSNAGLGALIFQNTSNALIGTNGGSALIFATLGVERFRIDSTEITFADTVTFDQGFDYTDSGAVSAKIGSTASTDIVLDFVHPSQDWAIGIDNSDARAFVFSASGTVGTSNALVLNTDSSVEFPGNVDFSNTPTVGVNDIWHAGNDGSGSGLDADTVDGVEASALATLASPAFTGLISIDSASQFDGTDASGKNFGLHVQNSGGTQALGNAGPGITFTGINTTRSRAGIFAYQYTADADQVGLAFYTRSSTVSGNDDIFQRMTLDGAGNLSCDGEAASAIVSIDDGVSAPSAVSGKAKIYVDSADGDLKIKFGDGTTKTIVTD